MVCNALKAGFSLLIWLCLCVSSATANDVVTVSSAWSLDRGRPGDLVNLAVVLSIPPGYHINPNAQQIKPTEDYTPVPTRVQVTQADKRLHIASATYPPARLIQASYAGGQIPAFEGKVIVVIPIRIDEDSQPGTASTSLRIRYQACDDHTCFIPQTRDLTVSLPVSADGQPPRPINQALFQSSSSQNLSTDSLVSFQLFRWRFQLNIGSLLGPVLLLVVAGFGGLLLNFTPCVLPLIPIKIISLSNAAQNRKRCLFLGLFMSAGVVAFWLVLALMIAFISDFTTTNQLFHYPLFTITVGGIIATMAVGMCGLFTISPPPFLYRFTPSQETLTGSFGLGIMTAVLSTPCTAPFMGAAAAWAATKHPATTLITFAAIGIGMALPYIILSAFPVLVSQMPRSGPAGILIKQVMGLLMLAAAAYFMGSGVSAWLTTPPDLPSKAFWWVVLFFSTAAGAWLMYRTYKITPQLQKRMIFSAIGLLMISISWWGLVPLTRSGPIDWIAYTPQRLETALKQGQIAVLDFTAEWCLNCKALESSVLSKPKVVSLLEAEDVVPLKVDLTAHNPDGRAKLKKVGQLTIPLLVVYAPTGKIIFKSDFYTPEQIASAIHQARQQQ
jgi:thiol:disulfide interchange protein DsbD